MGWDSEAALLADKDRSCSSSCCWNGVELIICSPLLRNQMAALARSVLSVGAGFAIPCARSSSQASNRSGSIRSVGSMDDPFFGVEHALLEEQLAQCAIGPDLGDLDRPVGAAKHFSDFFPSQPGKA